MNLVVTCKTPAKINCFLRIIERLETGYHSIVTLFRKVSLWDTITITVKEARDRPMISVSVRDLNVPEGKDNLAYKAADAFLSETGLLLDVEICIRKKIPLGAGLGGGSSDAACVLKTLNEILERPLSPKRLKDLSMDIGADCAFFLLKEASAIGRGTGDELEPLHLAKEFYLLIFPGFPVSTRWAYSHFMLTKKTQEISFGLEKMFARKYWINDLEEVVFKRYPVLRVYKERLIQLGARIALMTGSGSTIFGVFATKEEALRVKAAMDEDLASDSKARAELVETL